MQKILRRVATAERVVAKRQKAKSVRRSKGEKSRMAQQTGRMANSVTAELKDAKQAIKDAWALGPNAPRRDIGEWAGAYGAIGEHRYSGPLKASEATIKSRCQWAGGPNYLCLAVGDRVVLLEGPDKGRIGEITDLNLDNAEVTVENLNKSNVRVVPQMRLSPSDPTVVNLELPIPIDAVRLVHPITDPATGETRDVIINQLVHKDLVTDRQTGKRRWERVVPGLNLSIPWPPKPEREVTDHDCDTLRIDVDEKTFVPTLLRPPMPEAVIDELRGKYSRFRTRHDPEYVARKEAEEQAEKDKAKLMDSMRTPLQEFHRAERESKKKKGKPRLTLEMLEKIGEVIAKNRERSLNAAGVTDVTPASDAAQSKATPAVPPPAADAAATETAPSPSS
ncbi:KOW domain-containing protein [Xylariaceae sp. FL0594]|nr:KOW domain-containing protein [Xylariaceae sp. FL0594]